VLRVRLPPGACTSCQTSLFTPIYSSFLPSAAWKNSLRKASRAHLSGDVDTFGALMCCLLDGYLLPLRMSFVLSLAEASLGWETLASPS
jgi:hypothetical protein